VSTYETPRLIPGSWYVTYTSDDDMHPVYVTPTSMEQDPNGVWEAALTDSHGTRYVKEGGQLFSFYARVETPVLDRDNPNILEKGALFEQFEAERDLRNQQRELLKQAEELRIRRITAGGTR